MEENRELEAAIEGILFASGEPVPIERICAALSLERTEAENLLCRLRDYYAYERRGIRLLRLEDRWQLCSSPDHADVIRKAFEIRKPAKLSQPALEALTIIAYYQPTTRAYVEKLRGVDSKYTVNLLAERGLIEECGRLQVPGRPALYRTTEQFLRAFHLESLDDLPPLTEDGNAPPKAAGAEESGAESGQTELPLPPVRPFPVREALSPEPPQFVPEEPEPASEIPEAAELVPDFPENAPENPPAAENQTPARPRKARGHPARRRRFREARRSGPPRRRGARKAWRRYRTGRRARRNPAAECPEPPDHPAESRPPPGRRKRGRWIRCLLFGCWVSWPWWLPWY